ncbi:alpha/beta fold hydrolase [Neobacillus kokaensis]|uniref:Class III poly(R)-hydroxyalkanoic acid synthase subunit PhaC n=1 Tax=Neobacillus kokaensis TaxID=2759023 RepID=A0ABQ3N5S9_9BACI|nr:alpha/beta fold hydrolase [Neobacillus kokaensis]GHH98877.1 class III poly(R)-hydroxyalkanoic acid synthase subunit PhaC [Neobacillus kokaensis]
MSKKKKKKQKDYLELEKKRWKGFENVFHSLPPESNLTPRQAIWKKNKAIVWFYPAKQKKYKIPLVLIYSLVNQPFILDLGPGSSTIQNFVEEGFDVYLIDFGVPGYEDKDLTINDYITKYIQKGVQKALHHSKAKEVTLIGYCLGGTLAAMYAAIAEEPIKNLILTVAPIDFSSFPAFEKWFDAAKNGQLNFDDPLDTIGLVPGPVIQAGVRAITSPIYFSHYLSLLNRSYDKDYVDHWHRFNHWTNNHIPFPSAALKQVINDMVIGNKLIRGGIYINGKFADLHKIYANLLVISSKNDRLVPENLTYPVMDFVSSEDKTYISVEGGHVGTLLNDGVPKYLKNWLHERSVPI